MAALVSVIAMSLLGIFFGSPLRQRVEDKLFDLRTRISPVRAATPLPLIVTIDSQSLKRLGIPDIDYGITAKVVTKILASGAESVTVLLHPQVYSYDDPLLTLLTSVAEKDPRLFLGVFDVDSKSHGPTTLPHMLRPIAKQVFTASLTRDYRRSIVREMLFPQSQDGRLYHAVTAIARSLSQDSKDTDLSHFMERLQPINSRRSFRINYPALGRLPHISLESILSQSRVEAAQGRTVILGYSAYRPARDNQYDATLVNSPWQEEGRDVEFGVPLTDVLAAAAINLAQRSYLEPVSLSIQWIQVITVAVLAFSAWYFSAGTAAFLFLGVWALLFGMHALLFAYAARYIPLADTALFSTIAMIAGALLRIRTDGRLHAVQEVKAQAQAQVASVQERFLDAFAAELASINRSIHALLTTHPLPEDSSVKARDAHQRALQSCEELQDYLQGIENFARQRAQGARRVHFTPVNLHAITSQVLKQFESRQTAHDPVILLNIDPKTEALAEPTLCGHIVYNLISNAIKYSPSGSLVQISAEVRKNHVLLHVEDQGPGIAPEHQKLIFEKFYRIKNDQSFKVKGHGLGLYLSQYFATLIGAEISVISPLGAGTTFTLCLKKPPSMKT
jgi:signal transduction histidine kinase